MIMTVSKQNKPTHTKACYKFHRTSWMRESTFEGGKIVWVSLACGVCIIAIKFFLFRLKVLTTKTKSSFVCVHILYLRNPLDGVSCFYICSGIHENYKTASGLAHKTRDTYQKANYLGYEWSNGRS